ncbi:MAG TPA: hypothetical protein EYH44_03065 [Thermoprotei archaeon]|nr:hypothetical protein [Thermoprotei archaeon]
MMKVEILKVEKGRLRLKIEGETFTFGNILQKALLGDKRILGAGFHQPHPVRKEIIFDIYFKDDVATDDYKKIVLESAENMIKYLNDLKLMLQESLGGE